MITTCWRWYGQSDWSAIFLASSRSAYVYLCEERWYLQLHSYYQDRSLSPSLLGSQQPCIPTLRYQSVLSCPTLAFRSPVIAVICWGSFETVCWSWSWNSSSMLSSSAGWSVALYDCQFTEAWRCTQYSITDWLPFHQGVDFLLWDHEGNQIRVVAFLSRIQDGCFFVSYLFTWACPSALTDAQDVKMIVIHLL